MPDPQRSSRVCHWCGRQVPKEAFCRPCWSEFDQRPKPEEMTPDEREAEFRLLNWVEVPIDLMKDRVAALLGRPFWRHEMGSAGFEALAKEVRWEGRPSTMEEVIARVPPGMVVIQIEKEADDA